jgi:hypothetical protein
MTRLTNDATSAFAAAHKARNAALNEREKLPDPARGVPKRKYNLEAMRYYPAERGLNKFMWNKTPQGYQFWADQRDDGMTEEGRAALAEMAAQWKQENE